MDHYPSPSTLPPQSPPAGQPNALFRPRRSDDWLEYRETIEQLYRSDQLKLRDVKRIMEREYKFVASEKQYKDRLAAWNVRKNIKAAEVQVMIRKKQKRAARGKQTAFRRAGQDVDPKKFTRFVRRYGTQWVKNRDKDAELQSPEPTTETPSDMSCYTPEREEESATPISPLEVQSPTRETPPYPLNYDPNNLATMPDLVIAGDDDSYAVNMHSHSHSHSQHSHSHSNPPRRPYHPSELARPQTHHPSVHSMLHPPSGRTLNPIHPVHTPVTAIPPISIPSSTSSSVPASTATPAPVPAIFPSQPQLSHRDDMDAPGEVVSNFQGWTPLDIFQSRLEGLQYELDRSMSKWSREQDPNHEISGHHEGLGQ
ncbi:uncharacterized protein N7484_010530 [Penicillium longicatenatum]|uniref:uncharacterized protein n=1 Tax=Penicillium longicatenatum TaxID=1561947 RepID=UPI002548AC44|nr:uncharacterized protein N7484_010530 [Penicillium longicatenatum]KAJ5630430.1 hypothetical protein N7484_010530 [Penicillium longicatenatum]